MKKDYDDDDGRTIADMSGVERPGMFGHLPGGMSGERNSRADSRRNSSGLSDSEQPPFSRKERFRYTLAALKAGLLIGMVYIIGFGALLALLYLLWVVL